MSQPKGIPVAPLTGLLDMRSSPDLLPQGALRFRQNWQTVAEGKLRRGCGWTKAFTKSVYNNQDFHDQLLLFGGTVCEPITGEWEFQSARGIRSFWIATQSRIAKLNETTGNYKIIASGLGGGAGTDCSGPRFKATNVGDYVIFTNGHDRPKIHRLEQPPFDDVLIADIPDLETIGLTKAAVVFAWKDIVIMADVEMDGERKGNRFVWGNVKDPTSFDPSKPETIAGFADLNYGERILAGGETTAGTFLMYTTAGIWELTAVNDDRVFVRREAYPGRKADFVGCLKYQNTLLDIGGDHLYMAKDGIYAFNPYRSAPELVTWLHRASSVLYDDIDEAACAAHIGWFHDGEAFWSVKRTSDMACPGITLRVETQWKVADTIDHGFTAATNFRPQPIPTIRDFILDKRICTLEGLTESLEAADLPPPFENEGLPAPFDEPTAEFTPTVIHTHSVYQFGGTLTVSGAGTSPANGTYVWNYSTGRYENSLDWYIVTNTDGIQRQWKLYNDLGTLAYTNSAPLGTVEGTWTTSNAGMDPKPTVVAGEDVVVSEDFEQLVSDSDSLCALMGDTTIDDLCQGCEAVSVLIAASAQDLCLKQFGGFYRERCANPCSVGTVAEIPTCVDVSPITIGTEELTDGTQGEAYSFQMQAAGGSGNFIWAVVGGTLPAGLTLNASGLISGTPTESGSFEISIRASDAICSVDDADVTLTIAVEVEGCAITSSNEALALTNGDTPLPYMSVNYGDDYRGQVIEGALPKGSAISVGAYGTVAGSGEAVVFLKLTVVGYDAGTDTITIAAQDWDFPDLVGLRVHNPSFSENKAIGAVTATTIVYMFSDFTVPLVPGDIIMIGILAASSGFTYPPNRFNTVAPATGDYYIEVGAEVPVDVEETLKYEVSCVEDTSDPCAGVRHPASLYAYYKLDESVEPFVDSHSGKNMVSEYPAFPSWVPTAATGKIGGGISNGSGQQFYLINNTVDWDLVTGIPNASLTVRMWLNVYDLGAWTDIEGIGTAKWQLKFFDGYFRFITQAGVVIAPVGSTGWHRAVGTYKAGCYVRLQVDNEPPVDLAYTGSFITPGSSAARIHLPEPSGGPSGIWTYDEIAIWRGELTDEQLLYDWNGGAGRTYPDVPI